MGASNYVYVEVQVIRQESEKAFQVVDAHGKIYWLPKSQVQDSGDYEAGDRDVTLAIPEWLALEKEIETS